MTDIDFVPLDFPEWIRWGQRRGASIDNVALAVRYPDHRYWTPEGYIGAVYHCGWCGSVCTGRRKAWCQDACKNSFYRVWSWGALANYVFERDGRRCRRCDSTDGGPAHGARYSGWQVDHIVPVRNGGTDDPENLRLLCHDCHVAVGYEQRAAEKLTLSLEGISR